MRSSKTLYDLFNVDRGATPAEIRAAYLKLMKRHHPDTSNGRPVGNDASCNAASLNAGFAILRDARRRAEYNAQLDDAYSQASSAGPFVKPPKRVRHNRDYSLQAAAAGLALMVLGTIAILTLSRSLDLPVGDPGNAEAASIKSGATLKLNPNEIRRIVGAAVGLPQNEAIEFSRRCFRNANASQRFEPGALCVIFDNAVLLWKPRDWTEGSASPYFQLQEARTRHVGALSPWNDEKDRVLINLRSLALDALVQEVRLEPFEPPLPALVAKATAGIPPPTGENKNGPRPETAPP